MPPDIEIARAFAGLARATAEAFQRREDEWRPGELPVIVAMAYIGHELVGHIENVSVDELRAIFKFAEETMLRGTEPAATAIATGFLEAILAEASEERVDFRRFAPFLGSECKRYCREWDRFTGIVTDGLEE